MSDAHVSGVVNGIQEGLRLARRKEPFKPPDTERVKQMKEQYESKRRHNASHPTCAVPHLRAAEGAVLFICLFISPVLRWLHSSAW